MNRRAADQRREAGSFRDAEADAEASASFEESPWDVASTFAFGERVAVASSRSANAQIFLTLAGDETVASDRFADAFETLEASRGRAELSAVGLTAMLTRCLLPRAALWPTVVEDIFTVPLGAFVWLDDPTRVIRYDRSWDDAEDSWRERVPKRVHLRSVWQALEQSLQTPDRVGLTVSGGLDTSVLAAALARVDWGVGFTSSSPDLVAERHYQQVVSRAIGLALTWFDVDRYPAFSPLDSPRSAGPLPTPYAAKWTALADAARQEGVSVLLHGGFAEALFAPAGYALPPGLKRPGPPANEVEVNLAISKGLIPQAIQEQPRVSLAEHAPPWVNRDTDAFAACLELAAGALDEICEAFPHPLVRDRYLSYWGFITQGARICQWHSELSQSSGVSLRSPLVSRPVLEAIVRVPSRHLIHPAMQKPFQRSLLKGRMPGAIRRRKHHGSFSQLGMAGLSRLSAQGWLQATPSPALAQLIEPENLNWVIPSVANGNPDIPIDLILLESWLRESPRVPQMSNRR